MNQKKTGVCPRCHGTGRARAFNRTPKYSEALRARAIRFWDRGWTLRKIAARLKLKYPQTVKNILVQR